MFASLNRRATREAKTCFSSACTPTGGGYVVARLWVGALDSCVLRGLYIGSASRRKNLNNSTLSIAGELRPRVVNVSLSQVLLSSQTLIGSWVGVHRDGPREAEGFDADAQILLLVPTHWARVEHTAHDGGG